MEEGLRESEREPPKHRWQHMITNRLDVYAHLLTTTALLLGV